jgi:uncharacterized phage infection (PIP) family protein YhgE
MIPIYNSLETFFAQLLGTYTPVTYEVDGISVIASGFAGVDWPYIIRAVAFLLVFYCIFRLLGVLLCK